MAWFVLLGRLVRTVTASVKVAAVELAVLVVAAVR
jgi:hypothetical protein